MFWWSFQSFVIAGLLAGVIQLACRLRRIGPVGRHALWLIVLLKLVTPPLILLHWPWDVPAPLQLTNRLLEAARTRAEVVPHTASVDATGPAAGDSPKISERPAATMRDATAASALRRSSSVRSGNSATLASGHSGRSPNLRSLVAALQGVLAYSTGIWLIGGLAFALIQCVRIGRVARSVRAAGPAALSLSEQVDTLARRLRVRPVRTRMVAGITSPLIWCVNPFRPQLLWPAELLPNISEDCQRGLIVHELAHVRRLDHWVGWLELAAGCAWWWNPLFWYVRSQLRENAELACDAWVISELPDARRAYAEALLAVCAGTAARKIPIPALGVGSGSRRILERRLAMIMRERVPLRLSRVGGLSIALLSLASLPAWAQRSVGPGDQIVGPSFSSGDQIAGPIVGSIVGPSFSSGDQSTQSAPPQDRQSVDEIVRSVPIGPALRDDLSFDRDFVAVPRDVAPGDTSVQTATPSQPVIVARQAPTGTGPTVSLTLDGALEAYLARNLSVSTVRNAYWDLVYATEAVESARQSLALANKLVEDNTIKVEMGTLAKIDLTSAQAAQAQRNQTVVQAENTRRNLELALKSLIVSGTNDPNWLATIDPIDRPEFRPAPTDLATAIARARTMDPLVMNDITGAAITLGKTAESVQAAQATRELSQQRLEAEQRRFEAGLSTNYTVVQAQRDLSDARLSELRAVLNYRKAQVEFDRLQETAKSNANIPVR